jgi:hypothetical protein
MCDSTPDVISTSQCNTTVTKNWTWQFPSQTINIQFSNPISNTYGMQNIPINSRAVCNFSVEGNGLPSCTLGFFTKNGNLYIDCESIIFCAYQIGKKGDSYIMRSQDGFTTSTLTPQ